MREINKELNHFLTTIYKNKKELNLYLTSGNNYCLDFIKKTNFTRDENIKEIINTLNKYEFNNFKNIIIDSNYITLNQCKLLESLNVPIIVKIYNNNAPYQYINMNNYIDNIKYYNQNYLNIYCLNDNNIDRTIVNYPNLIIKEGDINYLTDDLTYILSYFENKNYNESWDKFINNLKDITCYINNSLTIDVHTLDIIPCTGLNITPYILGTIKNEEIISKHEALAIRFISCDEKEAGLYCSSCNNYLTCKNRCYYKVYKDKHDPFLNNESTCIYNYNKGSFMAYLYDNLGIRKTAIETKEKDLIENINNNVLK